MSNTKTLGMRLLKENDVANHASINHMLARLDVTTSLALESTSLTTEPSLTSADAGKAWAVSTGATGAFWGTLQDDAICIWTYSGSSTVGPVTGGLPSQQLRWHAIPAWEGAYAYDKATGTFVVYDGDAWVLPSRNKVVNVTLDAEAIASFSGATSDADNWFPAVTVDSNHALLEIHTHITYNSDSLLTAIPMENFLDFTDGDASQPQLPYIRPKVRTSATRAGVTSASDVVSGQASAFTDYDRWHIPSAHDAFPPEPLTSTQSTAYGSAAAMTGFITNFDTTAYPTFNGMLLLNLSDVVAGDGATGLSDIETITFQIAYTGA